MVHGTQEWIGRGVGLDKRAGRLLRCLASTAAFRDQLLVWQQGINICELGKHNCAHTQHELLSNMLSYTMKADAWLETAAERCV